MDFSDSIRRYDAPPTRLPFVNGEIACTRFDGEPHLVSAIWGGAQGGRLYFWNPETGHRAERRLPDPVPGAYMLQPGPDGCLYIGGGNGDLLCYSPDEDVFAFLAREQLHGIIWHGCVTDRYVVASANPGDVLVYDWREDRVSAVLSPADPEEPQAHYGHNIIEAPDGHVLIGMNVPQARLLRLDPETAEISAHTPACLRGCSRTAGLAFLDPETLLVMSGQMSEAAALLRYPEFEFIDWISPADGRSPSGTPRWIGDELYAVSSPGDVKGGAGNVFRINAADRAWETVLERWPAGTGMTGVWQDRALAGVSIDGIAALWEPGRDEVETLDLEPMGVLGVHCFCPVPQKGLIAGAPFINRRFWTIDAETGEGRDVGVGQPGGGQINAICWDSHTGEILLASYTSAAVMGFDPDLLYDFGANPRLIARADSEGQMRPLQAIHDGRHLWMTTHAKYGRLNGALCRIDPREDGLEVWAGIFPDQNPCSMVMDSSRRRLYLGSTIHADCQSAPPLTEAAEVLAFDMERTEPIDRIELPGGAESAHVMVALPEGDILLSDGATVYRWGPGAELDPLETDLPGLSALVTDGEGRMWAGAPQGICRLEVEGLRARLTPVLEEDAHHMAIAQGTLYWSSGTRISALPLEQIRDRG